MKLASSAIVATALFAAAPTAVAAEPPRPSCGGVFGLCGFVDGAGTEIVPARFEKARRFRSGLAAVRVDGRWGFVLPSGQIAIEPRFQAVGDFLGGRAEAAVDGRAGVIDRDGTFVIPPKFSRAYPFTDDVALVLENDDLPPQRIENEFGGESLWKSYRLFHRSDGWLTGPPMRFSRFDRPAADPSGLIWAAGPERDAPYGLMNQRGEWVVQPSFGHVQELMDGRAVVAGPKQGDGWGAVDGSGKIVIPLEHRWLSYFDNGYALLGGPDFISPRGILGSSGNHPSRKLGIVRSDGVIVAEPVFDGARKPDRAGDAPQVNRDGVWYALKPDGALEPIEPDGSLIASCPQGLRLLKQGAGFRPEDAQGRPAFPDLVGFVDFGAPEANGSIRGSEISSRRLDCSAPIGVRVGTLGWTYVRADGRALFDPPRYFADGYRFSLGHVAVATAKPPAAGEWGIVDVEGRFTLPLGREPVSPRGGYASPTGQIAVFSVGESDTARLTDAHGRRLPEAEEAQRRAMREAALWCQGGARISGDGERFGIVGPNGETLVPAVHRAITCFAGGVAWAPRDDRKAWCPIGVDGAFRDAPACDSTFSPSEAFRSSPEKFSEDPYESNVLWMRAKLQFGLGLRDERPKVNGYGGARF